MPNAKGDVRKGKDMPRNTPPHPNNSGAGALGQGLRTLSEHMSETHSEPSRLDKGSGNENKGQ